MPRLILASSSPRRQGFIAALGLDFTIEAADIDETSAPGETPAALVRRLSRSKALTVAVRHMGEVVLAADTVVVLDGQILGKPADRGEAIGMLAALRGRGHEVFTSVSVASAGTVDTGLCRSQVWMRSYATAEIQAYVATGDPLDKAGAYAIQHPLFSPVERWEGCFAGIMGLPLGLAANLLGRAGIALAPARVLATCERASGEGRCCLRGAPARC